MSSPRPTLDAPEALDALARDPVFGPWLDVLSPPAIPRRRRSAFAALASIIVHQQLAGAAARAIHGRFVEALGGRVRAETVLATHPERLRGAGLSRAKLEAIVDLASKASDGTLRLRSLWRFEEDDLVEHLSQVRGIGEWSAQMFLIFDLRRPDVWPVGDLAVRHGWARIHGLTESPKPRALRDAADHLRPWRSTAAWYCWRASHTTVEPGGT